MLSKKLKNKLFVSLVKVRAAEETIVDVYHEQKIKTPTHLSIGQEAVAVGVCAALNKKDQIFASHRCHAVFLARGGDLHSFFGELCGRQTGSNQGRAGSAHLSDSKLGVFTSPILAGMIPVAAGAAFSFLMDHKKNVAVCFFGDAAIEEGAFAETLNFALLKKLPMIFVCENNLYSTHTHIHQRQPASAIFRRIKISGVSSFQADGNDVEAVYALSKKAIVACRQGQGPVFLEFLTYRFREHVGPLYDYDQGYRTKKEVESWQRKCPIRRYKKELLKKKIIAEKDIFVIEERFKKQAWSAYQKALKSPWPDPKTITDWTH